MIIRAWLRNTVMRLRFIKSRERIQVAATRTREVKKGEKRKRDEEREIYLRDSKSLERDGEAPGSFSFSPLHRRHSPLPPSLATLARARLAMILPTA